MPVIRTLYEFPAMFLKPASIVIIRWNSNIGCEINTTTLYFCIVGIVTHLSGPGKTSFIHSQHCFLYTRKYKTFVVYVYISVAVNEPLVRTNFQALYT